VAPVADCMCRVVVNGYKGSFLLETVKELDGILIPGDEPGSLDIVEISFVNVITLDERDKRIEISAWNTHAPQPMTDGTFRHFNFSATAVPTFKICYVYASCGHFLAAFGDIFLR
jgi:hypothetical protein